MAPDIQLSADEARMFGEIDFEWGRGQHDFATTERNGEIAFRLMKSLLASKSIPEIRIKWFTDPEYKPGVPKGSNRDMFRRNGHDDESMMRHPHFLPHLTYFVCGPNLPPDAILRFKNEVASCGNITSGDVIPLSKFARSETRAFRFNPHDAAEEYYKLALECGVWNSHAQMIRKSVLSIR